MVREVLSTTAKEAKNKALRFLKIRPRSIEELRQKLEDRGFSREDIAASIKDLIESGLLDDRAFTKSWINYRLVRPFGFRRIIQELRAKGIDAEIIDQAMEEISPDYNAEAIAQDLANRRWQRLPILDDQKKKKRVLDFLLRRGFDAAIAIKVIKKLK